MLVILNYLELVDKVNLEKKYRIYAITASQVVFLTSINTSLFPDKAKQSFISPSLN